MNKLSSNGDSLVIALFVEKSHVSKVVRSWGTNLHLNTILDCRILVAVSMDLLLFSIMRAKIHGVVLTTFMYFTK